MLIVADFNFDQIFTECVIKVNLLIQNFNFAHRSQYSTHIKGGILDLVFDTLNSNTVSSLPSPYSDHFILFFPNLMHDIYTEFSCKPLSFQFSLHNS